MRSERLSKPNPLRIMLTKAGYLVQETTRSLKRGGWMNWAAISTVTVLLFLFGLSLQTSWQVSGLLGQMGSNLEISVFMKPEYSGAATQATLQQFPHVAGVDLVSKDQAWTTLLKDLGTTDIQSATTGLGGNPLVDELKVRATSVRYVGDLVKKISNLAEVDEISYLDEALVQLSQISNGLSKMSFVVVGLLTVTAIAVINTTIRLIVVARQQEIEVMQLVGATTLWIYLPFLLQGITFGLIGSGIAGAFMAATRRFAQEVLSRQPNFLKTVAEGLVLSTPQMVMLPIVLITFGCLVGFTGSLFAVRRFIVR